MIALTDIRCGCGGLCDSNVVCPMASNVEPCECRSLVIHSQQQHDFVVRRRARRRERIDALLSPICPACKRPQSSPSCQWREHWG